MNSGYCHAMKVLRILCVRMYVSEPALRPRNLLFLIGSCDIVAGL